ncbi:cell division protein ZipA [Spongiibacter sp. KMU-158]|uniref:Cell division protein ZipA n=1 Tax=Spongiibacter pelagi TaxID=2760804 RepID=A0A927C0J7_9GAMM|nr:cell division protein ZipA [Spongiibacter pelagi]MBD2859033.1 cell division protein ZipA [Spongiibacter pelagi]
MDLGVRELLIIVGVLLATAVLLDGFRRMRREREDTLRMKSKRRDADDDLVNHELPNGPARVVAVREHISLHERRADSIAPVQEKPVPETPEAVKQSKTVDEVAESVAREAEKVDHSILFTDPAEEFARRSTDKPKVKETRVVETGISEPRPNQEIEPEIPADQELSAARTVSRPAEKTPVSPKTAEPVSQAKAPVKDTHSKETHSKEGSQKKPAFQELFVLNVVAEDGKPYRGADLLQVLLGCDLRYGRMKIFHRHEQANGAGAEQFSVANLVEPGNFELDGIENFSTPGVVFFMELPGPENTLKAFEAMLETANCLVSNLGGEMRDQSHSVATKQTLEHYKQRIRDFERRQMTLV